MSCITEILKLKGDKEALVPDGDWIAVEGGESLSDLSYMKQNGFLKGAKN